MYREALSLTVIGRDRCLIRRGDGVIETFGTDSASLRRAILLYRRLINAEK